MQNNFVIYKLTSPSGKSYIGQTCNLNPTRMGLVAQNKIDNFKGWNCQYLFKEKAASTLANTA
jgi:hypothetical protein